MSFQHLKKYVEMLKNGIYLVKECKNFIKKLLIIILFKNFLFKLADLGIKRREHRSLLINSLDRGNYRRVISVKHLSNVRK